MGSVPEDPYVAESPYKPAECHRFEHDAMGSSFGLTLCGEEKEYARQVAQACFEEVDRLEQEMSRYVEQSDVSRINALSPGETVLVSPATFDCLELAREIYRETGGAFDVTVSELVDAWQEGTPSDEELQRVLDHVGMDLLALDEDDLSVGVRKEGVTVDLGGIGKGYAVDRLAALLEDWSVDSGLAHAGQSSVLAAGPPPGRSSWPIALRDPRDQDESLITLELQRSAVSGSGIQLHGPHIIDPRTGRPIEDRIGAWATAPTAARSDALSTAFMIMTREEARQYHNTHPETAALVLERKGKADIKKIAYGKLGDAP